MRILVISDVHANSEALRAVERDAGSVDRIVCAGDLVDDGTDPCGAIQWIRDHGAVCVSGNHDRHLLDVMEHEDLQEVRRRGGWKWVHDNIEQLSAEDAAWLRKLPEQAAFEADGVSYILRHQMQEDSYAVPESLQAYDRCWKEWHGPDAEKRRMIFGHTHRRCVHMLDEKSLWLNPGSVSYRRPDDDDKRAHYMVIEDGQIFFHAVSYDRSRLWRRVLEMEGMGLMEDQVRVAKFFFGD